MNLLASFIDGPAAVVPIKATRIAEITHPAILLPARPRDGDVRDANTVVCTKDLCIVALLSIDLRDLDVKMDTRVNIATTARADHLMVVVEELDSRDTALRISRGSWSLSGPFQPSRPAVIRTIAESGSLEGKYVSAKEKRVARALASPATPRTPTILMMFLLYLWR